MTVYVVMQDDGNVCCPATVVRAVCATREVAERLVAANTLRERWSTTDAPFIEEWTLDEYAS